MGTQLCTYSQSELLAADILAECPLELNSIEHEHCPCRRRETFRVKNTEVRVLTCCWPKKWNGQLIVNPPAFKDAIQKAITLKLKATAYQERLAQMKEKEKTMPAPKEKYQPPPVPPDRGPNDPEPPLPPAVAEKQPMQVEVVLDKSAATTTENTAIITKEETTPAPTRGQIIIQTPFPPTLAEALYVAQQQCRPVEKKNRNAHHGYSYAAAEAIIIEAKAAMRGTGLSLAPLEQSLNRDDRGGWELSRKFVLLHTSGERLPITCNWPVVEEKGRPIDKATAISATVSYAYTLRDLLQMPRIPASEDLAARKDPVSARSAKAQAEAGPIPGKATGPQLEKILELREKILAEVPEIERDGVWKGILKKRNVESARELAPDQADELIKKLCHQLQTEDLEAGFREPAKSA